MAYMIITSTLSLPYITPKPFKGTLDIPFKGTLDIPFKGTLDIPYEGTLDIAFKGARWN